MKDIRNIVRVKRKIEREYGHNTIKLCESAIDLIERFSLYSDMCQILHYCLLSQKFMRMRYIHMFVHNYIDTYIYAIIR